MGAVLVYYGLLVAGLALMLVDGLGGVALLVYFVGMPLGALAVWAAGGRSLAALDWVPTRRAARRAALGLLSAAALVSLVFLGLRAAGWATTLHSDLGHWLIWLVAQQIVVAAIEELAFRGVIQRILAERWGAARGLAGAAILFGLFHLPNMLHQDVPPALIPLTAATLVLMGGVFGAAYQRSGHLLLPFVLHLGWNLAAYGIEDGLGLAFSGPRLLTGSARWFPESGLLGALALALLGLIVGRLTAPPAGSESDRNPPSDADRRLEHSEARYRALLQSMPDLLFRLRRDGTFLDYKAADGVSLYAPPDAFLGRTAREVLPAPLADQLMQAVEISLRTRETRTCEYQLVMPDGPHDYEARHAPCGDDDVLIIIRDISGRKQAEAQQAATAAENARLLQQVQAQADQLAALYAAGQYILSTLQRDETLMRFAEQITGIADACSALICQYQPESQQSVVQAAYALEDTPCYTALPPPGAILRLAPGLLRDMRATGRGKLLAAADLPHAILDAAPGSPITTMMIVPMINQGHMTGVVLIGESRPGRALCADQMWVCEALANQAAIAADQAALFENIRELERVKSAMIRMASHDLRSPLNRIQTLIEDLQPQIAAALPPDKVRQCALIADSAAEIQRIITEVLSLERIEARYREAEPVIWNALLAQVSAAMAPDIESRRQTLRVQCSPDLPALRGDPVQLNRAIANLIANASKYTAPGGEIEVRVFRRDYGGRLMVAVEVEDNGIGLTPEQQAGLFRPFYRARQPGTEQIPGVGLGLAVVKAAVEYHRGSVYCDSEPGQGSVFGFRIPV